ncbi:MAG TPA: hypothetical protein PKX15_09880 [Bacteroidales bacterium]|nr:hypothetical protein [Bacteroidales bacterium]
MNGKKKKSWIGQEIDMQGTKPEIDMIPKDRWVAGGAIGGWFNNEPSFTL